LTLREVGFVLTGHANAHHRDLELAYYTAWYSGLFSQPCGKRKFPDYKKNMPRKTVKRAQTPADMERLFLALTKTMGGTIN
jgi:hypothetical protein